MSVSHTSTVSNELGPARTVESRYLYQIINTVSSTLDLDRVLHIDDLVGGDVFFVATGITDGELLRGVQYRAGGCTTQSLVMRSRSGTIRSIDSLHSLEKLRAYSAVPFDRDEQD